MVSYTPRLLGARGKRPGYPLIGKLSGPRVGPNVTVVQRVGSTFSFSLPLSLSFSLSVVFSSTLQLCYSRRVRDSFIFIRKKKTRHLVIVRAVPFWHRRSAVYAWDVCLHLILSSFLSKIFEHCQFLNDLLLISFIYPRTMVGRGMGYTWEERNACLLWWENMKEWGLLKDLG